MIEFFLHIGLHKTGTKFFQHKVFPNLNRNQIKYNPPKLCQLICDLLKAEEHDVDFVLNEIYKEKTIIRQNEHRERMEQDYDY